MAGFAEILRESNDFATCMRLVLLWIATADDHLSVEESRFVEEVFPSSDRLGSTNDLLRVLRQRDPRDLHIACQVLRGHLREGEKNTFLALAVGVAVADGKLSVAENLVLRFLADLLNIPTGRLEACYRDAVGRELPKPNDLGSAQFWDQFSRREESSNPGGGSGRSRDSRSNGGSGGFQKRIEALAILGLSGDATIAEIKEAYRRLARIHHPDKFETLGREAVEIATRTMQRIQGAYDYLVAS